MKKHVIIYDVYQRTKVKRYLSYSILSSFPLPSRLWQEIILDFIIGLLLLRFRDKIYNSILVIVNRYMKIARYILIIKEINIPELVELFILHVVKDFGILSGIISDRGSVFISKF